MDRPEVRVGQIWMLRNQYYRVKITLVERDQIWVRHLSAGQFEGCVGYRLLSRWNGECFAAENEPSRKDNFDMMTLIYDPQT